MRPVVLHPRMASRRDLLAATPSIALAGCLGGNPGDGEDGGAGPSVSSAAFTANTAIPERHTCDGEDVSPPLSIRGTPDGAETLAVVVDDPDAPGDDPFVHWLLWNLPADVTDVPEGVPRDATLPDLGGAVQGRNDFGDLGYSGPCPPEGDGPHTYRFTVSLVDTELGVDPGAGYDTLAPALDGDVLGESTLTGTYER